MDLYNELIETIRREQMTLFIGSGFSLEAGAPTSKKIIDALKKEMDSETKSSVRGSHDLQFVSDEFVQMSSREKLIEVLQMCFRFKKKPSIDHELLSAIPYFDEIYTTNYDTLLEDTYGDKCCVIRNDSEYAAKYGKDNKYPTIFKIHGDFSFPDDIVITKSDYENYYKERRNSYVWQHLSDQCVTKNLLFIGYSLEDSNVRNIVEQVRRVNKNNRIFLIAPGLHERKIKRIDDLNITYINSKATPFLAALKQSIEDNVIADINHGLVSIDRLRRVCSIHHCKPQLTFDDDATCFDQFLPVIGEPLQNTVNFEISKEDLLKIQYVYVPDLEKEGMPLDQIPEESGLWAYTIDSKLLKKFDVRTNDIRRLDKNSVQTLYLFPQNENQVLPVSNDTCIGVTKIIVPSKGLDDYAIFVMHRENKVTSYLFNFHAFSLRVTVDSSSLPSLNFHAEAQPNKEFDNLDAALKWIDLLQAIMDGEQVFIPKITGQSNFNNGERSEYIPGHFAASKLYYQKTKELEDVYGKKFSHYENYSPKNLEATNILLAYKSRQFYNSQLYFSKHISLTYSPALEKTEIDYLKNTPKVSAFLERELNEIEIHHTLFKIPNCFQRVQLAYIEVKEFSDTTILDITCDGDSAELFFSDQSLPYEKYPQQSITRHCSVQSFN